MPIDFSPIHNRTAKLADYAKQFTLDDLRAETNAQFDEIRALIEQVNDAQLVYVPYDPDANDPYAAPGEEHLGWSLAHLVVHTTASLEEAAAFSSILARGIPLPRELRLRYETHWTTMLTQKQALERIEESRRICLAYLNAWPTTPHLDVYREMSERFVERFGNDNAKVAYLLGLLHQDEHLAQYRKVLQQAKAATEVARSGD